jgi:membrane protein
MNIFKNTVDLVKTSFKEWKEDNASRLAAALAYYTIFSISPLLIIALAIAGQFIDQSIVRDQLMAQISGLVGQQGADIISTMLQNAHRPTTGLIASIFGIVTLLLGASGFFGELQGALNTIWEVAPKPNRGIWGTIKDRFFSFTMVLGLSFLLLVSLVISTGLSALNNYITGNVVSASILLGVVNFAISFGVIALIFALIFKFIPDVEIAWRDVWFGAVVTAILFMIGKTAIGIYLGTSSVASSYGVAGSLVVLLLWIYYSAQILFLGAEFTQVFADKYGKHVQPDADAVPMSEEKRIQQGMPHESEVEQRERERQTN